MNSCSHLNATILPFYCERKYLRVIFSISKNRFFFRHEWFSVRLFWFQVDSEEERLPDEKYVEELAKKLPQGTDKTPEVLEEALKGLPDK